MFGRNEDAQLGFEIAGEKTVPTPRLLECSEMKNVRYIGCGCGGFFSFALTSDEGDNLFMWGYGESGQLANGGENAEEPERIDLKGRYVISAAAGGQHSVFLLAPRAST